MKATRISPTLYTVEGESCSCTRPGCDCVVGLHFVGEECPKCAASGVVEKGKLERRTHQVDLEEFNQNGSCGCEHFQMTLRKQLLKMPPFERVKTRLRCKHLLLAREVAKLDENFDALLALLPNQGDQV